MAATALAERILPGTKDIPYISAPLAEAIILCIKRAPEKLIVAAILREAYSQKLLSAAVIKQYFGLLTLKMIMQSQISFSDDQARMKTLLAHSKADGYDLDCILETIEFASRAHRFQPRKEAGIPFISHPLTVGTHLALLHAPQYVIQAGILHDVPEDTESTISEILARFGEKVSNIVFCCTEFDKSMDWEVRKERTIEKAKTADLLTKLVICADKLNNLQSIYDQLLLANLQFPAEFKTAEVWSKFKRGYDQQKWYYQEMVRAIFANVDIYDLQPIFGTLMRLVEEIFGEEVIADDDVRELVASR
jgi:(p)ppGpp synthase/HD superfamily hydrolase